MAELTVTVVDTAAEVREAEERARQAEAALEEARREAAAEKLRREAAEKAANFTKAGGGGADGGGAQPASSMASSPWSANADAIHRPDGVLWQWTCPAEVDPNYASPEGACLYAVSPGVIHYQIANLHGNVLVSKRLEAIDGGQQMDRVRKELGNPNGGPPVCDPHAMYVKDVGLCSGANAEWAAFEMREKPRQNFAEIAALRNGDFVLTASQDGKRTERWRLHLGDGGPAMRSLLGTRGGWLHSAIPLGDDDDPPAQPAMAQPEGCCVIL